jgi:hypothetical protein
MKISQIMAMASALLLMAGCAREQSRAQNDQNFSPAYSSTATGEHGNTVNHSALPQASSGTLSPAMNANATAKSGSESDNTIVAAVRESLRRDAEIAPIVPNIQIAANNGAVVLNGSVQSEEQKREIGALAQQATGVVAINNQLQIISVPASPEPAGQIQPNNPPLNPTSLPNGADKIYQENNSQPNQNTNSNQIP